MSYIHVENIKKTFKVAKKKAGLKESLKSLFKRDYIYIEAIKDVSFDIEKGEIIGYIGPNGAGKSTTIKMLSGILMPDSGVITIDNLVPYENRIKYTSKIGVVFGAKSQLWWDIPAIDTFNLLKDIYNLTDEDYNDTLNELINLLNLKDIINIPVRQLSLGSRMRCELAASLLHKPEILFLDEPTIGLDAISKKIVRDFIKKINEKENVTVILTTHDMTDIECLAKRIILIGKGSVLYDGSLSKLKTKYDKNKYVKVITKNKITSLRKKGIVSKEKVVDGYMFTIDTKIISISDFLSYLSNKIDINDIEIDNENIDNIIINLYKEFQI